MIDLPYATGCFARLLSPHLMHTLSPASVLECYLVLDVFFSHSTCHRNIFGPLDLQIRLLKVSQSAI